MESEAVLTWLARLSSPSRDLAPLPERLCCACVAVAGSSGGAITMEYAGQERMTVVATDRVAARLEDLQEVVREGPGWDAHNGDEVVSADLGESTPWPLFAPAAVQELGRLRMCAAPIRAGGGQIGVLTLYWSTGRDRLPEPAAVQFLADVVGAAFFHSEDDDLLAQVPWFDRATIHQAAGVVIAQLSVPVEDAMALLRAHAFASGDDLVAVAQLVLSRKLAFTAPTAGREEAS